MDALDQCKVGRIPHMFAGVNRSHLSRNYQKHYPQRDLVVSQMEINEIDQVTYKSATSRIHQKPTLRSL